MTVINTDRTAHCPLCNKSINRRTFTEDGKVGTLVEKARNLIGNIGQDTGLWACVCTIFWFSMERSAYHHACDFSHVLTRNNF
jgi:hypothetical protein